MDELPTLPAVAVKLLHATNDANSRLEEICALLRGDQSLTAKLLSLANSAATGAGRTVVTVDDAVRLLGLARVRCVVLTVKVFECFGPGQDAGFRRADFWKHVFGVACAARRFAELVPQLKVDPGEAFVAGLLHDIGKVALDAIYPKAYARIASIAVESHGDIADAEREVLGVDHTVAGRRIAERWGLPRSLQEVIWLHHLLAEALPRSVQAPNLIALVQTADVYVREQRIGFSGNYVFYEPAQLAAQRVGIGEGALDAVAAPLISEIADWSALLGLDTDTPEAVYLQALSQANAELGRLYNDLMAGNRRLASGARFFRAIAELDRRLDPNVDLPSVMRHVVEASASALQRRQLVAFGLREQPGLVDLAWLRGDTGEPVVAIQTITPELQAWLDEPGDAPELVVTRAPRGVRGLLVETRALVGNGDPWLLPLVNGGRLIGGLLYLSEQDERAKLSVESDDLRSFLTSLAMAISRANAHAAAQRLSDDLAENNRRLQQMQAEVLRSRTLASIAELAAGAGHELNSPLAVISGRAQMLQQQQQDPATRQTLQVVIDKAHECSRIVKELMDFAKPKPLRLEPVELADLLEHLRQERLELDELPPARLGVTVADEVPPIRGDREQIESVFRELLRNALLATQENEGAVLATGRLASTPGMVETIISDGGYGMSQAVMQRAFDPFFSHRPAGRGRGLGLPRAYRMVDVHGGKMWMESRAGEGTAVHVLLPIAATEPVARFRASAPTSQPLPPGAS